MNDLVNNNNKNAFFFFFLLKELGGQEFFLFSITIKRKERKEELLHASHVKYIYLHLHILYKPYRKKNMYVLLNYTYPIELYTYIYIYIYIYRIGYIPRVEKLCEPNFLKPNIMLMLSAIQCIYNIYILFTSILSIQNRSTKHK